MDTELNSEPAGAVAPVLMTQVEYAAHRGVSKQAVNKWVQQGRVRLIDGKIDRAAADQSLAESADPARHGHDGPGAPVASAPPAPSRAPSQFQAVRTAREAEEYKLKKLEYERAIGSVVDLAGVQEAFREIGRMLREALETRAITLAPKLAGLETSQIAAELGAADQSLLDRLTHDFNRILEQRTRAAQ